MHLRVCARGLGHARVSRPAQKRAGGFSPGSREPGVGCSIWGSPKLGGADRDVRGSGLRLPNLGVLFRRPRVGAAGVVPCPARLPQGPLVCTGGRSRGRRDLSGSPSHPARLRNPPNACSLPAPQPPTLFLRILLGSFPFLAFAGCCHWSCSSHMTDSAPIPPLTLPFLLLPICQEPCLCPIPMLGKGAHQRRTRSLPQGKLALMPRADCSSEENQALIMMLSPLFLALLQRGPPKELPKLPLSPSAPGPIDIHSPPATSSSEPVMPVLWTEGLTSMGEECPTVSSRTAQPGGWL